MPGYDIVVHIGSFAFEYIYALEGIEIVHFSKYVLNNCQKQLFKIVWTFEGWSIRLPYSSGQITPITPHAFYDRGDEMSDRSTHKLDEADDIIVSVTVVYQTWSVPVQMSAVALAALMSAEKPDTIIAMPGKRCTRFR